MDKYIIIEKLKDAKPLLSKKYGVTELALFGSYSRNEQTDNSDIDVMVDFENPMGLKYFDMVYELKDLFKDKNVQVVSKGGIKPNYFERIKKTYYMPKRDDDLLISDMIECCEKIMAFTKDLDYESFLNDKKTVDAVIRNFEVLGEAAKYISEETQQVHPLIEWRKIADFRNVLIHNYFGINYETMWEIIQDELPQQFEFIKQLNENL